MLINVDDEFVVSWSCQGSERNISVLSEINSCQKWR